MLNYRSILEFLEYPQRFAYSNPMTDKGKKVRWACHSSEYHRLLRLVSKLPPPESKTVARNIELYNDPEGDTFIYFVEEKKTATENSTY